MGLMLQSNLRGLSSCRREQAMVKQPTEAWHRDVVCNTLCYLLCSRVKHSERLAMPQTCR